MRLDDPGTRFNFYMKYQHGPAVVPKDLWDYWTGVSVEGHRESALVLWRMAYRKSPEDLFTKGLQNYYNFKLKEL